MCVWQARERKFERLTWRNTEECILYMYSVASMKSSSVIIIPVTCLLGNFRSTSRLAHDDAVYAQHRHRSVGGQPDRPLLGDQRVENLMLRSIKSSIGLLLYNQGF